MIKGVAITGIGILSSIGNNVEENWHSLQSGQPGISDIKYIETIHRGSLKVGEVGQSNAELIEQLQLPENNNFTRTSLLGVLAVKEALRDARIEDVNAYKTGLVSATSVGGMDINEMYFNDFLTSEVHRKYIPSNHAGDSTQKIADYIHLKGFTTTISTACSSSANAIMLGAKLIQSGKLDRVIVGGADALSKFTINGFNTLLILSDTYNTPFDQNRKGLNLGEGAAFLVLESEELVKKYNKKVWGYISGYGNANDAFHQTASSENGDGAYRAMQRAFAVSTLKPQDIDYINVHGTATPNNDLSEGRALIRIFGEKVPDFSSTKPFTGHTLAAAAAIEAVFCLLALEHQVIYPNLHFCEPMQEFNLIPNQRFQNKKLNHILSNSFGFGGNCSSLIFSKNVNK